MAVKKTKKKQEEVEVKEPMMAEMKLGVKKKESPFWMGVGWTLLLVGGLAHMLPEQLAPLLSWSKYGVSLQSVVGVVSVVMALYFLLGE